MRKFDYKLFADYFQFYIQDESAPDLDPNVLWPQEAVDRHLAVAPGHVVVGTVRNMTVPVTVEIVDSALWDQINECNLEAPSGRLVIAGCTDYFPEAARIAVLPGSYRVRLYYGKLDSLSEDGLNGDDHYRLVLWQAHSAPLRVLKQHATTYDRPRS